MCIELLFYSDLKGSEIKIKRSKFNIDTSQKGKRNRTYENVIYDSELEMKYFRDVINIGLKDGSIIDCKRQVKYELQPSFKYQGKTVLAINYVADFVVTYADNSVIVWDAKGLADATAKLKKKLFHFKYPNVDYRWVGFSAIDGGWVEYDVIQKGRTERKKEKNKKGN